MADIMQDDMIHPFYVEFISMTAEPLIDRVKQLSDRGSNKVAFNPSGSRDLSNRKIPQKRLFDSPQQTQTTPIPNTGSSVVDDGTALSLGSNCFETPSRIVGESSGKDNDRDPSLVNGSDEFDVVLDDHTQPSSHASDMYRSDECDGAELGHDILYDDDHYIYEDDGDDSDFADLGHDSFHDDGGPVHKENRSDKGKEISTTEDSSHLDVVEAINFDPINTDIHGFAREKDSFFRMDIVDAVENDLKIGQLFESKELFKFVVRDLAVRSKKEVQPDRSTSSKVVLKCREESCEWRIRANQMGNTNIFQITKYISTHTCGPHSRLRGQDHRQASISWIASKEEILLKEHRDTNGKKVKTYMKVRYGIEISTTKARRARELAREKVYGNFKESFSFLRGLESEIDSKNDGSITEVTLNENGTFNSFFGPLDHA